MTAQPSSSSSSGPSSSLSLRPYSEADEAWMRDLYHRSRAAEFAGVPAEALGFLLDMQFRAQVSSYLASCPAARIETVLWDGQPVGRIIVNPGDGLLHLMDILLDDRQRGRGIGQAVLQSLQQQACQGGIDGRVQLSVRPDNPARRLYLRCGFQDCGVASDGFSIVMMWTASRAASDPQA